MDEPVYSTAIVIKEDAANRTKDFDSLTLNKFHSKKRLSNVV